MQGAGPGASVHLERVDGEELLVWTQTKHPAGDAPFSMTYYFRRQE